MANFKIKNVNKIEKNKAGQTINLHVIYLVGQAIPVIRRPKEFLQDLKNSDIIDSTVTSINHPSVKDARKALKGGRLSGDVSFLKKGDTWTVTENSRCITDSNHPEFGKRKVGDNVPATRDQSFVGEGFLDLTESMQYIQINAVAKAYAASMMDMDGAFDFDDEDNSTPDAAEDMLPDEFIEAAAAE